MRAAQVLADDKQCKAENLSRRMYGVLYYLLASLATCLLVTLVVSAAQRGHACTQRGQQHLMGMGLMGGGPPAQ